MYGVLQWLSFHQDHTDAYGHGLNPARVFLVTTVNNETEKKTQISRAHFEYASDRGQMFLKAILHEGEGVK